LSAPRWRAAQTLTLAQVRDPMLAWAAATDWRACCRPAALGGAAGTVRVIAELRPGDSPHALAAVARIDEHYLAPIPGTQVMSRFLSASVHRDDLEKFAALVSRFELAVPRVRPAVAAELAIDDTKALHAGPVAGSFARPAKTPAMVVGIVDDGCAFLRDEFAGRDPKNPGTRILAVWDQGTRLEAADVPQDGWQAMPNFGYGRHLFQRQIDVLRRKHRDRAGHREAYRKLRYPGPEGAVPSTHGTSVMSLAAATKDPAGLQAVDSDAGIVFVHLPRAVTLDTSGGGLGGHLLDGVRYILAQAHALRSNGGPEVPVVVNVSYGNVAGPHDGSSLIEQALDELIEHHPCLSIVVAAGNAGACSLSASGSLEGPATTLEWAVPTGDDTDSFVQIWLERQAYGGEPRLELLAPRGAYGEGIEVRSGPVAPGQVRHLADDEGRVVATLALCDAGPDRFQALVALAPTTVVAPGQAVAAPGTWRIAMAHEGAGPSGLRYHAFVQRDDELRPGGTRRQSRFTGDFTPGGSLSAIATGLRTHVVGAHRLETGPSGEPTPRLVSSSGRGPTRGRRSGPDVTGQCELPGSRPLPTLAFLESSDPAPFGGTSASAPIVTRLIASHLATQAASACSAAVREWLLRQGREAAGAESEAGQRAIP
jgi:hypothetical protein